MSHSLQPLSTLTRIPEKTVPTIEAGFPPSQTLTGYRRSQTILSSSPARSSSPPGTPFSSRYSHHHLYIQSSPPLHGGFDLPPLGFQSDDPPSLSHNHFSGSSKHASIGHISQPKYRYYDERDLPPSSEFDMEDLVDDAEMSVPELDSETTSESTPGHASICFSDSEDEGTDMQDGDGEFDYGHGGFRSTFFRVSAERGRWKDDPMALKLTTSAGHRIPSRQSMPTLSRPPSAGPSTTTSPISEPVESSKPQEANLDVPSDHDQADNEQSSTSPEDVPSPPPALEVASIRNSSSAPSPRETTPECDAIPAYSSPLPSSSPPLSPMSGCGLSLSRSVSPLSFAPSSPMMMPQLSPSLKANALQLEELDSGDANADVTATLSEEDVAIVVDDDTRPSICSGSSAAADLATSSSGQDATEITPEDIEPKVSVDDTGVPSLVASSAEVGIPKINSPPPDFANTSQERGSSPNENATSVSVSDKRKQKSEVKAKDDSRTLRIQDDNVDQPASSKLKVLKRKQPEATTSHGLSKKQRVELESLSSSDVPKPKKGKKVQDDDGEMAEDELPEAGPSKSKARRKATRKTKTTQFLHDSPQKPNPADSPAEPIDEEMKGMLIECMATSRASSLAVSSLCRLVLQTHPYLKGQRAEREWRKVINRVLYAGMAPRGSGIFGKVDSSGKDDSDRPLEAQWFYVPELDEDQDRAALIRSMMPRPAKRSETKKYKQYYWRPLDKISRWDPEDDL